jgi:hypothetical protein
MMPWGYLIPTELPRPESADHPIVDEDLVEDGACPATRSEDDGR